MEAHKTGIGESSTKDHECEVWGDGIQEWCEWCDYTALIDQPEDDNDE